MAGRLAALIRSKYPGAYDDMDDATLERTVLAKYPEYADLAKEDVAGPSSTAVPSSAEATALGHMRSGQQGFSDEKPPSEPDTYWGGFRKGLSDYATELGSGMFQSAAHPQTASDVLGLVAPTMKASLLPHAARMPAGEGIKYTGRLVSEVPGDVTGAVSQIPARSIVSGTLRGLGSLTDSPAVNYVLPRGLRPSAMFNTAADWVGKTVQPVTDVERTLAGTIGRTPQPPSSVIVNAPTAGTDQVGMMLDEARAAREAARTGSAQATLQRQAGPPPGPRSAAEAAPQSAAAATAPTSGPAPVAGISAAERADLVRRGFPPDVIARLEQELAGAAPPITSPIVSEVAPVPKPAAPVVGTLRQLPQAAPATVPPAVTGGPARPTLTPDPASLAQLPPAAASVAPGGVPAASSALPTSAPSPLIEQLQASLQQGRTPAPVTGQVTPPGAKGPLVTGPVTPPQAEGPVQMPTADMADPMTQDRLGVGAERVARQTGKTIEQVREETGSLHGEEIGTASDIFPQSAFDRMYAKMRAMKGVDQATRDALRTTYAESARDPKARAQLLTIMRGLSAEGLVIPIGAAVGALEALRSRVRQRLAGEQ